MTPAAVPESIRWDAARAARHLVQPDERSDKYRRGVLGLRTGSTAYPGAAVLGVEAAWRTGIGLVRYVPQLGDAAPAHGLPTPAAAVLAARPETVFVSDAERAERCDAWVVGSGTDPEQRGFAERAAIERLLAGSAPVVLDAGALALLTGRSDPPAAPVIATPHRGEFLALWRASGLGDADDEPGEGVDERAAAATALARALGATVLLKGSETVVATPGGFVAVSGPATPGLATAGTGDVLAGALGAIVAAQADAVRAGPELLGPLGATAALLHDAAARIAAGEGRRGDGLRPVTALDVAHALPEAVAAVAALAPPPSSASREP